MSCLRGSLRLGSLALLCGLFGCGGGEAVCEGACDAGIVSTDLSDTRGFDASALGDGSTQMHDAAMPILPIPTSIAAMQPGQWMELPNTKIRSVLPNPVPQGNPANIITAWGGGTVDTTRNRMIVWGGGHMNYWGNEVYALDLGSLTMKRIVDPSPVSSQANCESALPDGTPTSRHTYDGLAYMAHKDTLLMVGGSIAPCGYLDSATWSYDFSQSKWAIAVASSPIKSHGAIAVYDPTTKLVFAKDQNSFFSYSLESNAYDQLNDNVYVDYHVTAAIDAKRRKFVMIGDGVQVIDLATHQMTTMTTSNAPGFVTSQNAPGIAYDPAADRIVAWHGGSDVYALDMDTGAWTQVAINAGPGPAAATGTYGRWGYVPQFGIFVLVNDIDQNAWVFKHK